jgi:hypothetical protein
VEGLGSPLYTPTESEVRAYLALPIALRMAEVELASNLTVSKSSVGSGGASIPSPTLNDSDDGLLIKSGKRVPLGTDSSTTTRAASTRFKTPVLRISI